MKKAIVLGAAMLLASTAAFAASDIKFSGSAQAGYSFSFGEDNITRSWKDWDGDGQELTEKRVLFAHRFPLSCL